MILQTFSVISRPPFPALLLGVEACSWESDLQEIISFAPLQFTGLCFRPYLCLHWQHTASHMTMVKSTHVYGLLTGGWSQAGWGPRRLAGLLPLTAYGCSWLLNKHINLV